MTLDVAPFNTSCLFSYCSVPRSQPHPAEHGHGHSAAEYGLGPHPNNRGSYAGEISSFRSPVPQVVHYEQSPVHGVSLRSASQQSPGLRSVAPHGSTSYHDPGHYGHLDHHRSPFPAAATPPRHPLARDEYGQKKPPPAQSGHPLTPTSHHHSTPSMQQHHHHEGSLHSSHAHAHAQATTQAASNLQTGSRSSAEAIPPPMQTATQSNVTAQTISHGPSTGPGSATPRSRETPPVETVYSNDDMSVKLGGMSLGEPK